MKHGMAAECLVPEAEQARYDAAMARWKHEMGPDNVVEEHLVRRAAVASVTLDRIDEAREDARQDTAREAVRQWERKQQASARRKAQNLALDPFNVVLDLEGTAFGCDWLIRQWQALDSRLAAGASWDRRTVCRAQNLLGYPDELPGPDAEPVCRSLWLLAAAIAPHRVSAIPRLDAEASLPADPSGARAALRHLIAEQVDRLEALRVESWDHTEGPECRSVARRAAAADTSSAGQLHHRYHRDADRSANAAIRLYLNNRDRRRRAMLEVAKEARHCSIPRVPVGGGWWREVDSDPSPPGHCRIESPEPATGASAPPPTAVGSSSPPPSPSADPAPEPAPPSQPAGSVGRRNEPISPGAEAADPRRNLLPNNVLRNESSHHDPGARRRTEPSRTADQPGRSTAGLDT